MKVLFAVNNEEVSEAIVKKYQKKYKEIISYKNVYYFNAILKEMQKDKTYDRIVISEDLEQFTNTSYEQMDKFIFEKLDSISDEASNMKGEDIPIILICTERRNKSEEILVKLFGIGIYNAIIGNDRSVDEVCRLISKPRLKKEAKTYYQIDTDNVSYKAETENDVSEAEIQNILAHFKRLGKNEAKYVESYDSIAAQYNDNQLKVISMVLPLGIRAVLEEKSAKYQQVMSFNKSVSDNLRMKREKQNNGLSAKLLTNNKKQNTMDKPIVVPTSMKTAENVKKLTRKANQKPVVKTQPQEIAPAPKIAYEEPEEEPVFENINLKSEIENIEPELIQTQVIEQEKDEMESILEEPEVVTPKKGRGRPRKNPLPTEEIAKPKRGRGRPKKNPDPILEEIPEEVTEEELILPGMKMEQEEENLILPGMSETSEIEDEEETIFTPINNEIYEEDENEENIEEDEEEFILPMQNNNNNLMETQQNDEEFIKQEEPETINPVIPKPRQIETNNNFNYSANNHVDLSGILQGNKKIAAFVGTSKNGTSFIVNNLAEVLSTAGVNVAILDTTRNRNSYYIYTKNEEDLRKTATYSISNLSRGTANGIRVNNNLAVYTSLPNEEAGIENVQTVLETLVKSHTVVLIDCDFWTPRGYFSAAQEVYLVQTMDVLTIQPLTAFLKDLIAQSILEEQKIRVIINKYVKIRGVSEKEIIGGMAYYNDPAMTYQTGLFDKSTVKYITIPFEEETYTKYLQGLIDCEISLKGYSKNFLQNLRQLSNMVYPAASGKGGYRPPALGKNDAFSDSMNNTLNQMKRNY